MHINWSRISDFSSSGSKLALHLGKGNCRPYRGRCAAPLTSHTVVSLPVKLPLIITMLCRCACATDAFCVQPDTKQLHYVSACRLIRHRDFDSHNHRDLDTSHTVEGCAQSYDHPTLAAAMSLP